MDQSSNPSDPSHPSQSSGHELETLPSTQREQPQGRPSSSHETSNTKIAKLFKILAEPKV